MKILGVHFSYNQKLQNEKNFVNIVKKIQQIIGLWKTCSLSLEGKILIFKTLAISKIVYISVITVVPRAIVEELQTIQKLFLWHSAKPKIKHNTLCSNFENGGLKNVDINFKIKSLQCSWIKKLYDENFHKWKIIPLYLINKYFGSNFKFHSNLSIDKKILKNFPKYYEEIFMLW